MSEHACEVTARVPCWALTRLVAGLVAIGCATVLGVAGTRDPAPTSVGTHMQLCLPPVPILEATGVSAVRQQAVARL